ncbi:MAG: hypothetical protein AAB873_03315, partial [Patescibacteria group bacterium]
LTQKVDWGEVTGSDDGSFTDTGSDKYVTDITYSTNTTDYVIAPKQESIINQSSVKVRESRSYYDELSHGSVAEGNMTKHDSWKDTSNYVKDFERTYNAYGLVTTEKDPRNYTTTYSYDSYNLYPASVTNPLSQATAYTYDYSSGKVKQTTDVNSRVFQTIYDGLDRPLEEKQPNLNSPTTLVLRTTYAYTPQTVGNQILRTDYLDGTVNRLTYTYTDGLDRVIQTRTEQEDGSYSVTDTIYNNTGEVSKISAPYSSSGTAKTSATTTTNLLTTYTYDAMKRVLTEENVFGTLTNTYDDWKQSITDRKGKTKHFYKEAHNNLSKVDELNDSNTYTTLYEYDGNKSLTKITDSLSNIRNFTYDKLGRRLTAEDSRATSDSTYGTWTYTYDNSGNITQIVDPKSQTINFTYDNINRLSAKDYTGDTGTEVTYSYDSGTDGIGRLTSYTSTPVNASYAYNAHGLVAEEIKTENSVTYPTDYTYDRQGNILTIINPDSSKVRYAYNTAGQLETVERRESTDSAYLDLVTDIDYGPHGLITNLVNVNGTTLSNTYDSTQMYRLTRKLVSATGGDPDADLTTTTIYATVGDGFVAKTNANWATAHDATTGSEVDYTATTYDVKVGNTPTAYKIQRAFIPFDTSSIPDNAVITSAKLKVYVESKSNLDNDEEDFVTVV